MRPSRRRAPRLPVTLAAVAGSFFCWCCVFAGHGCGRRCRRCACNRPYSPRSRSTAVPAATATCPVRAAQSSTSTTAAAQPRKPRRTQPRCRPRIWLTRWRQRGCKVQAALPQRRQGRADRRKKGRQRPGLPEPRSRENRPMPGKAIESGTRLGTAFVQQSWRRPHAPHTSARQVRLHPWVAPQPADAGICAKACPCLQ